MIKATDIILELIRHINKCVQAQHYVYSIDEAYKSPAFLHLVTFNKHVRYTKFTQKSTMHIQSICFLKDNYKKTNFREWDNIIGKLSPFLNSFMLKVKYKVLKFDYEIGEANGHLSIDFYFHFYDFVNLDYNLDNRIEHIEMMEKIYFNNQKMYNDDDKSNKPKPPKPPKIDEELEEKEEEKEEIDEELDEEFEALEKDFYF